MYGPSDAAYLNALAAKGTEFQDARSSFNYNVRPEDLTQDDLDNLCRNLLEYARYDIRLLNAAHH